MKQVWTYLEIILVAYFFGDVLGRIEAESRLDDSAIFSHVDVFTFFLFFQTFEQRP